MPEFLVLSALLFLTAFVALPAAYPYFMKAHRQAGTIKLWEQNTNALPAAYPYFMKAHRQAGTIKLWEQNTNALNQQSAPLNE